MKPKRHPQFALVMLLGVVALFSWEIWQAYRGQQGAIKEVGLTGVMVAVATGYYRRQTS
jgi:predicted negative regulator of RcsB-dependent stress response